MEGMMAEGHADLADMGHYGDDMCSNAMKALAKTRPAFWIRGLSWVLAAFWRRRGRSTSPET